MNPHDDEQTRANLIRRVVFAVWIIVLVKTPYEYFHALPAELFDAAGVLRPAQSIVPVEQWVFLPAVLLIVKLVTVAGCIIGAACTRCRGGVLFLPLCGVWLLDSVAKSFQAYPNHAQIVPLLVLMIVVFATSHSAAERLVPWLSGLSIAIPYTFIGINRLLDGGTEIFTSDTLLLTMVAASNYHSAYGFNLASQLVDVPGYAYLVRLAFVAVTMMEVASVGAMLSSRWRVYWLTGITLFHLSSWLFMNIFFWENLLLIWAVFGPRSERGGCFCRRHLATLDFMRRGDASYR